MEVKKMVAVDKKKICSVIEENINHYICSGEITSFKVGKDRCQDVDDEYLVILNIHGPQKAKEYAKEKGYIE
jgi:hypothetical protein